jgi:hypothetical protein
LYDTINNVLLLLLLLLLMLLLLLLLHSEHLSWVMVNVWEGDASDAVT